jgi:hypothetical protein
MLTREQKIYLVKKVDCHTLSTKRVEALPGYFKAFPKMPSDEDIKEISDFIYINRVTVRRIAEDATRPTEGWRS